MRILPSSLALAFILSLAAAPVADALMWSSFTASTSRYDIRAAIRARRTAPRNRPASVELPAAAKGGLLWGDVEATTTIVMFSDIECPFCKQFHVKTYPTLKKEYIDTKKVRFVVRHFPLSFHKNAMPAAKHVVCARAQGDEKARALYERLFERTQMNATGIASAVGAVDGLDAKALKDCVAADKTQAAVEADMKVGTDAKVSGTPIFLIVGPSGTSKTVPGAVLIDTFAEAIAEVQGAKK